MTVLLVLWAVSVPVSLVLLILGWIGTEDLTVGDACVIALLSLFFGLNLAVGATWFVHDYLGVHKPFEHVLVKRKGSR